MPNGGFRVGIKTGLGLVKQTEGEQKRNLESGRQKDNNMSGCKGSYNNNNNNNNNMSGCKGSSMMITDQFGRRNEDLLGNHDHDHDHEILDHGLFGRVGDDDDDDWDCCARRLISREIPAQDN